jgi:ABC-2 type transport system ATP-binding protein
LGKNKTVLFSSHILQEVESLCDRVIIINKGNIVADDSLKNLQSANKTSHIVLVQFGKKPEKILIENLNGVENVEEIANQFHIETTDPEKLKKLLLEFSLQNNLDIISLQSKSHSLEEVFMNFTSN